jgi:hypothetical protein
MVTIELNKYLNKPNSKGLTPLAGAILSENLWMVQLLVKYGANINMFDPKLAFSPVFCTF